MVTPHGSAANTQDSIARDSDPHRAQYTAIPPHDIRVSVSPTPGPLLALGASFDTALTHTRTGGGQRHGVGSEPDHPRPHFNSNILVATDGPTDDYYSSSSMLASSDYLELSVMAGQYLGLSSQCSDGRDDFFAYSHSATDASVSSPEGPDGTASTPSPPPEIFSTQSSPGYLQQDLPSPGAYRRPDSADGLYPGSPYYLGQHLQRQHMGSLYPDTLQLPRRQSFPEMPTIYRAPEHWGVLPSPSLPSISQTGRCGVSQLHPHSGEPLSSSFGRYPIVEDLRRWPQMYSMGLRTAPKKQTLACHFCRDRKIGCTRPDEDNPDQTCNQCARRKRRCEYPTESRRGQHARRRTAAKKYNVPTLVPPSLNFSTHF